ncbi:hypothetical protein D3C85_1248480 [compost metagenome]
MHALEQGVNANVHVVFGDAEGVTHVAHGQHVAGPCAVESGFQQLVEAAIGQFSGQVAADVGTGHDRALADARVGDLVAGRRVDGRGHGIAGQP